MCINVGCFTDTYHPTVNGVTSVVDEWAQYWNRQFGRMEVVYPSAKGYNPDPHEHPVPSAGFPFYEGYYMGAPWVPKAARDVDIVHLHSLYSVGLGGGLLSIWLDVPLVASYHTKMSEFSEYITPDGISNRMMSCLLQRHERFALNQVDLILVPSRSAQHHVTSTLDIDVQTMVLSNGIDTKHFKPVPTSGDKFKTEHGLESPVVGFVGRHSVEKRLSELISACERMDKSVTLVLAGQGPETSELKEFAATVDVEVRFPGFVDRENLPALYSALDVFGFPSRTETEGIVAMESIACGTPVVGANAGALQEKILDDKTGYLYTPGDVQSLADSLSQAIDHQQTLREGCWKTREQLNVEHSIQLLRGIYEQLLTDY